MRYKRKKN